MPDRDWKLRIEDILESIAKVERYTAGMTFDTFTADEKTINAVVRNFTIIGEAPRYMPQEIEARYPHLPWREMRGMRNIVSMNILGSASLSSGIP